MSNMFILSTNLFFILINLSVFDEKLAQNLINKKVKEIIDLTF